MKKILSSFTSMDLYISSIMFLYCLIVLANPSHWLEFSEIIFTDIIFLTLIISIKLTLSNRQETWAKFLSKFYIIPMIYPMYLHTQILVPVLRPELYDIPLIEIDRWMFAGYNPTDLIHKISFPLLTEWLQICYVMFYLIPCFHAIELFKEKRHKELDEFARMMVFGFLVSYIAYFAFPAIGPRFTLHDFSHTNQELPGVFITTSLREFVNQGGGIESGAIDPSKTVNRDCMPSGHTMMTVLNMLLAYRFRVKLRWVYYVVGTSLVVSTVYLRYHYVIDVIAGILFALLVLKTEEFFHRKISFRLD